MAAANDRFSIRDYAARMRNVDFPKSWPFVGQKVEELHPPPISVRRFRWWADELSAAGSASLAAETKAAETSIPPSKTIMKTTEDEKLCSPKARTKLPKKRSIAELFASAPQMETVDSAMDKEDDETVVKRRRKGKRRKGKIEMEIRSLQKEKVSKSKKIPAGHRHLLQHSTNKKAHGKTTDCVPESKKSVKVKILQKKDNILQTPNPTSSTHKVAKKLPVRSILKSKNRLSSARETRKINDSNTVKVVKRCKTTRNVTFSGKDAILGHGMNCSNIDLPQFKSLCKIFSDVLTKSSVMKNSSKVHELTAANGGKQVANSSVEDTNAEVVYRTDEPSCQKNESSDSLSNVNHQKLLNSGNSSFSRTEKASLAVVIDLNHNMETCNDSDQFNSSTQNLSPNCTNSGDLETIHKKGSSTFAEFHLQRGLPKISPVSIKPTERNFVSSSNAADILTSMKNYRPHSPTPCLIACNDKKPCWQYCDVDMKCCCHIPKNQSGHYCSPNDLLSNNICHSIGCNEFMGSAFLSNAVSTSKSKSTGEDLISLSYNKHGELIQIHPGTTFVGHYTKQNMDLANSHGFYANKKVEPDINVDHLQIMKENLPDAASYQTDQLVWCQNQCYPNSERTLTEFFGPKRLNIQNNACSNYNYEFLHSQANKAKPSFHAEKTDDATLDILKKIELPVKYNLACQLEPAVKPTIRLMGQNVVVGASNGDCHSSMPEKYISKQRTLPEFVAKKCWSSNNCLHKLYDSPSNFNHATAHVETQFDLHIDDDGCKNLSRFSTTKNNTFKVVADSQEVTHNAFLNKTDKFIGNIISGEEPTRHQYYPTKASYQQNSQQNILLNSTHCNHSRGVSSRTFVTPQFAQSQIRYNFHENHFQPVHTQPPEILPPWLLHAKHKKWNQSPYSDPIEQSQPSRFSGTNLIPQLSPYNMPMDPLPLGNISPAKTITFAPNSSQSSFISVVTANNSVSEVTMSNGTKNKEKEGSYSNFTGFSSPVDAHKFQKRSARGDDLLMNSSKIPHFEKQTDYGIPVEPQGTDLSRDHKLLDYATALEFQKAVHEVDELSKAEGSSFSRLDKESTVGATELVSGAKHVLKPVQKIDDENFKPAHPTTNFPRKSTSGKLLSPQKQIAKIYEF
ncbi:uncharacterized protein LOC110026070 [Phalaenopsis equestris]|uniref:uncharacterized protein LOC110026070 n=1 Tax=Phalaenopsis equestris TaxID=78828 RepID=UPI0009E395D4|nr:uncharacterized protein LOC110026070 [Phalaenopsis equestris]